MARSNSPHAAARRGVLDFLAATKRATAFESNLWSVSGSVYQPHPDGPHLMGDWVPRPAASYPENQADHWEHLIRFLDDLTDGAATMREVAVAELARVRGQQMPPASQSHNRHYEVPDRFQPTLNPAANWSTEGTKYPARRPPIGHPYVDVPGQHACMNFDVDAGRCGQPEEAHHKADSAVPDKEPICGDREHRHSGPCEIYARNRKAGHEVPGIVAGAHICSRCGSDRWVGARMNGPDSQRFAQCVPCGKLGDRIADDETPVHYKEASR